MKAFTTICLALIAIVAANDATADGLRYVHQTIFGMDCAPCAYGVEKGLGALPGVENVAVSLNEGYAETSLASDSPTTLAQIRKTIRDGGFTPREATVRLEGSYSPTPAPTLRAGELNYQLHFGESAPKLAADQHIVVVGTVAADADSRIEVSKIEPTVGAD